MLTNRIPGFSAVALLALPVVLCGDLVAQFRTAVNPAANATVEGNSRRGWFSNSSGQARHQEVVGFSGNPFLGVVLKVAYRRDNDTIVASGDYVAFSLTFDMTMSTSPRTTQTISPDFASNTGADALLVFSGTANWPAAIKMPPGPTPFDYSVMLTTPFPYDSANGDLCIDIVNQPITNPNSLFFLDADASGGGSSSTTLGSPCGAGSANDSYLYDNWAPGSYARVLEYNGPSAVPVIAAFGTTSPTISGLPLPVDLFFIQAPGCLLQHDLGIGNFPGQTSSTGRWDLKFEIPNIPILGGQMARFQFINLLDAGAGNPAQLSLTAGHEVTLAIPVPGLPPQSEAFATFSAGGAIPTTAALVQQGYGFIVELSY